MAELDEKVACRTPAEGRTGVTNIPRWKFDTLRAAILAELGKGDVPLAQLSARVDTHLSEEERAKLGKLGWHVMAVKLEMEVRGDLARVPGAVPQMLKLGKVGK